MKSPRWLRVFLRIIFALSLLLAIFMVGVSWYASSHKDEILQSINKKLHEHSTGELDIESMSLSLLQDFPGVSVVLHNVSVHDTMWHKHHTDLLRIETVSVDLNPVRLLTGSIDIKRIRLEDGVINLFSDSNGYSNASALQLKDVKSTNNKATFFDKIQLSNITFNYEYKSRAKHFRFNIVRLKTKAAYHEGYCRIVADVQAKVEAFSFNLRKGSFLQNQVLSGKIDMDYLFSEKVLKISKQNLRIDKTPVKLSILLSFARSPLSYKVYVTGARVMFHDAMAWLTPAISSHISFVKITRPAEIQATIEGNVQYRDTPLVYVHWKTQNNELITPVGKMEKSSFSGYYLNHVDKYGGYADNNSMVALYDLKTTWLKIPLRADSVKVFNLIDPSLQCNVNAAFPAMLLNPIIGGESFLFDKGDAVIDINYKGRLGNGAVPNFNGFISLSKAKVRYIPRNLVFKNCDALLELNGSDLLMKKVDLQTEKSKLSMSGIAPNFFQLFYRSPKDIDITWNINSDKIDVMEFNSFLQPREKKPVIIKNTSSLARNLDTALGACTVNLDVNVKQLLYKTFMAEDISANVILGDKDINVEHVALRQSGGTIEGNGSIVTNPGKKTAFNVHAHITDVYVGKLFSSFNNFGQQAITSKNLQGIFSANVYVEGQFHSKSKIDARSMNGVVEFELRQGALVHFKPLEKINKFIFKKRNLSNVTFKDIRNTLYLKGDKILISPMRIESSALNIGIYGVYSYNLGTDLHLEIPLRNPQKDEVAATNPRRKKPKKGLILYLKAVDGKDSNVVITWDKRAEN